MSATTAGVVLLHLALGVLLIVPVGIAFARKWRRPSPRKDQSETRPQDAHNWRMGLLGVCALACALTGLSLALRAAFGASVAHDVFFWRLHIGSGFMGLALFCLWRLVDRLRTAPNAVSTADHPEAISPHHATFRRAVNDPSGRHSAPTVLADGIRIASFYRKLNDPANHPLTLSPYRRLRLMLTGAALLCAASVAAEYSPDPYFRDLTATNARQAGTPVERLVFPAGTRLAAGVTVHALEDTPSSTYCGRSGCHVAAYQEWLPSGHHFAGEDQAYRRVVVEVAAKSGQEATRWCMGCHEPLNRLRASGAESDGNSSLRYRRSEGVGCVVCHATVGAERTGNGHITLTAPQNYPLATQEKGWARDLHNFLLRVRPGPHQRAYLKPALHTSADFCGGCHRQSFNVAQNHYQFVRGPDEYGEWQSGPVSGRAARSASLLITRTQTCQECHFPRDAEGHVSHASSGANTALPALRGDRERIAVTEAFLKRYPMTLDLFCLRRTVQGTETREEWVAPLEALTPANGLRPGETITLDIVVSNHEGGHSFPAGYEDIKDAWLKVTLADAQGRTLVESGVLTSSTENLPPDTHTWRMVPLNRFGQPLAHHELTEQVTTVYRHVIAPGSSDIARYRLTVPTTDAAGQTLRGPLRLQARLQYRHLHPEFARWATGKAVPPALPITTLAEAVTLLPVRSGATNGRPSTLQDVPPLERAKLSRRYLDYGVALLAPREGPKLPEALRAFGMARELTPDSMEPLLGAGRAYLREPDLPSARAQLEQALRLAPESAAVQAELGVVYRKQGEYDRALALLRPLALQFPQDGELQFDLGLTLVNLSDYEGAAKAFQRALDADPDDASAHFQLMRCWKLLKRVPEARREETIGRYLAEDKMAPRLLPNYLRDHPEDRQALQPIPEHTLHPPARR